MHWLHCLTACIALELSRSFQCRDARRTGARRIPWRFLSARRNDGHSLHLRDEDSNEQDGGQIPPLESSKPLDDVVVMPPSTGPSWFSSTFPVAFFSLFPLFS